MKDHEVMEQIKLNLITVEIGTPLSLTMSELPDHLASCFEGMVNQIYPSEQHLNKTDASGTESHFFDLQLFISNDLVSSKIYNKNVDFWMVTFLVVPLMVCTLRLAKETSDVRRVPTFCDCGSG